MSLSKSFSSVDARRDEKCLICLKTLTENDKIKCIADNAWGKFKEVAKDWTNIKIDSNDEIFHFTEVDSRVRNEIQLFGRIHENCSVKLKMQINRYRGKYGDSIDEESGLSSNGDNECHMVTNKIRYIYVKLLKNSFICQKKRLVDNNSYNEGGISRCETDSAIEKLHMRTNMYIANFMMQHIDFKFLVVDIHLMISLQTFTTINHVKFRMQSNNTQRIQWVKQKVKKRLM